MAGSESLATRHVGHGVEEIYYRQDAGVTLEQLQTGWAIKGRDSVEPWGIIVKAHSPSPLVPHLIAHLNSHLLGYP